MYKLTGESGRKPIVTLLKLWIDENRHYHNGLRMYLAYKLGLYNSPSLGGSGVGTFKEDLNEWRKK